MVEIALFLDDVEKVSVIERECVDSGTTRLVNEWRAKGLPRMVLDRCGTDHLGWIDDALWCNCDWRCSWTITPNILKGDIRCAGNTEYQKAMNGKGTKVTFQGTLELDGARIANSFGLPGRMGISIVETVITTMIPRNFRKTIQGAVNLIQQKQSSPHP
jgi:hypothetical protein